MTAPAFGAVTARRSISWFDGASGYSAGRAAAPARNFTSALYLGFTHPSVALPGWRQLTTGVPAALREPPAATAVAHALATLTGHERVMLGPSTLHLFWDLPLGLAGIDTVIYMDAALYPIGRWGVERAAAHGVRVRVFPHHDTGRLVAMVSRDGARPLIVTDGFCTACGRAAPVPEYLTAARARQGHLVVDDTQALGILGHQRSGSSPYGVGGSGLLHWQGLDAPDVIVVASLAKAFGVPIAMLGGRNNVVARLEATSATRVHCSPPSAASLHAAAHALAVNRSCGDRLRSRLAGRVLQFQRELREIGLTATGGAFPVQTLAAVEDGHAVRLHRALTRAGMHGVLRRDHRDSHPRLTFILTARHTPDDIHALVEVLARALGTRFRRSKTWRPSHE